MPQRVDSSVTDTSNSGIYVFEGPARGQPIPVDGDSVTAFVGPTPRGPVDHAVALQSPDEFFSVFGTPECHCRLEFALRQFFSNGGTNAVVVRVSGSSLHNRICLPGPAGNLVLEARNPGPLECLRASVDYDGIAPESDSSEADGELQAQSFNLIIQRLRSPGSAWIDAQEVYRNISVESTSRDFVGYVLSQSELVQLHDAPPSIRPNPTIKPTTVRQAGYVDALAPQVKNLVPTDYDLIGSAVTGTGLSALDHVSDIGQVCLIPGAEGEALGPVAMLAADRFCRKHQALLIVDPPSRWQSVEDVLADQDRSDFSSPNAITWFPGVRTPNKQDVNVSTTLVGSIAAALNASNQTKGVHQLHGEGPVMLRGRCRLTTRLEQADVRRLARAGINSLVQRSPLHLQLLGNVTQARFGSIAGEWNNLDLRHRVLFMLRRIRHGTSWTFFADSTPEVWCEVEDQVRAFLHDMHARSALAGEDAARAGFVKCDADTNAGLAGSLGEISFVVGFAMQQPEQFLAFRFYRSGGVCRISELAWKAGFAQAS